jgi:hypothetical protein
MLIVVTIVMVVGTFALMVIGDSQAHLDRQGIAREFKISLERARYDSVKRNVSKCEDMSRVEIKSATVFTLLTDQNGDGILNADSESRTVDFGDPRGVEIAFLPGTSFPITIRFDRKGNSSSGPCSSATPATTPTTFCTLPCTAASANKENSTIVYVSPTGTTAYLTEGSRMPSITTPALDLLDSSNQINPGLAVWDPAAPIVSPSPIETPAATPTVTPQPSPSATASPTPSPTASTSPNPTITPTPSSTPAATPTARFCLLGEQPAINLCICSPLQYLQASSGKCRAL